MVRLAVMTDDRSMTTLASLGRRLRQSGRGGERLCAGRPGHLVPSNPERRSSLSPRSADADEHDVRLGAGAGTEGTCPGSDRRRSRIATGPPARPLPPPAPAVGWLVPVLGNCAAVLEGCRHPDVAMARTGMPYRAGEVMTRRLPRRLEGRDANDGIVQPRKWRWLIVLLVLLGVFIVAFMLFFIAGLFEPQTLESGRREIRAMKSDPVARFRPPGATLRNEEEHPAARDPFGEGVSTSSIRQMFEMTGDPGDTVEAYRLTAQQNGWQLVADGCSRAERATAAVFGKRFDGFDASLVVHAQLDRDPALDVQYGMPGRRALVVTLGASEANVEDLSVDAGLRRNDVHCLRDLDPSSPDLQPPKPSSLSMEEFCSRISVPAVKAIAVDVEGVLAQPTVEECWLVNASRHPVFIVERARHPRAYYEDRRLPSAQGSTESFLFSTYGRKDPDRARSVWTTTPDGPYVVGAGGGLIGDKGTDGLLFAVARLLSGINPHPTTAGPPITVAPQPNTPTLIEYVLDGGIAGTMRLLVSADGEAVYTGGTSQETQFQVPTAIMDELRAALRVVDFTKLSPAYGSGFGPDRQVEVVTYQGKTVRITSGGPQDLRRVTAVLSRLLDEARRRR